jgi:hypothetical protein
VSAALSLTQDVLPIWLVVMWLASIRWTQRDAEARLHNPRAIRAALLAAAALPFLGAAAWACIRPAETLVERRRRRLGRQLLELEASLSGPNEQAAEPVSARRAPSRRLSPEPASELAA